MTQTITRMFPSHVQAMSAVAELKKSRFADEDIHVVAPPAEDAPGISTQAIAEQIMKGYVLKSHAQIYAEGVRNGASLVTVHAPFGTAAMAIDALHNHGPIHSGVAIPEPVYRFWDEAAPISSIFQWPIFLADPTPCATLWNVPTLMSGQCSLSGALGLPLLSRSSGTRQSSFGLPLLSHKATPLSSMFGLPVLLQK